MQLINKTLDVENLKSGKNGGAGSPYASNFGAAPYNNNNLNTNIPQTNDNIAKALYPSQQNAHSNSYPQNPNAQHSEPLLAQKSVSPPAAPKYSSLLNNTKLNNTKADNYNPFNASAPLDVQTDPLYGRSNAYPSMSPLGANDRSYTGTPNSYKSWHLIFLKNFFN